MADDSSSQWDETWEKISDGLNEIDAGLTEQGTRTLEEAIAAGKALSKRSRGKRGDKDEPVPANPEAERHVLASMMTSHSAEGNPAVLAVVPLLGDNGEAFYIAENRVIYKAVLAANSNGGADAITVADHLERAGLLEQAGGREHVNELAALAEPGDQPVAFWARIIRRLHLERRLSNVVQVTPRSPEAIGDAARALAREELGGGVARAIDASDWLAAQPKGTPAVWGRGSEVLWAEGEPLMIYGPDGVGKSTVLQQVALHMCGVRLETFLDLPVKRAERKILYLACDRPRQIRRSLYRMLPPDRHAELAGRLMIWPGPLPFSIVERPAALYDFCVLNEAGYLLVDSLKDIVPELTDSATAIRVNHSFQYLCANEIDLALNHHPRKQPSGQPVKPKELEDVYGDRNFVSGMGSVISLWGKAGDPIIEMSHLKQPAEPFGPVKIVHDHDRGITSLFEHLELMDVLNGRALTLPEIAQQLYGAVDPTKNEIERARRSVRKYLERGEVVEHRTPEATIYRVVT